MTVLDTLKSMPSDKLAPLVLAIPIVIGFFAVIVLLFFCAIPEGAREGLWLLLGVLGKSFGDIVQFFVGSSSGSRAKDETIRAISGKSGN